MILGCLNPHLVPGHRPQDGELRALDVEAEQVHLVGDVGGQQQAVQGVTLHPLPGPQLLRDTITDLKSEIYSELHKTYIYVVL